MTTIVIVGSSNVDLTAYCDRFPDDGETLVGTSFLQGFGGKGANQAVMMARLGSEVVFVSRVGDDALGAEVVANFTANGVDVSRVLVTPGVSTGVAPIWVDRGGVNRILVVPGANARLSAADVDAGLAGVAGATVVVAQLETPQVATAAAFTWARAAGAVTLLNPAPAALLEPGLLALVDWLVPNETEFEILFGGVATGDRVAAAAARSGCRLAVTLGEHGAIVGEYGHVTEVPAPSASVVDTTGAGDAFVGGFATGLSRGWDGARAARLGCACGALSVSKPGAQASFPSRAEVDALL
jgi:ribokinase